jgi:type II secretion system protein D
MRHPHGFIRQFVPLIAACAFAFPVSAQNPAQNAAQGEMVTLRFPNADVRDVLSQYEILVGKRLVYDNQVQGQVNINVPEVTKEEAIRIIEITLMMNGYHLVPVDSDPNLIKVTGLARSPRQVAVPVYSDPEPIPDNEQVVMYLVKLTYADPTELAQILQQAMPPSRPEYAPNIVALPKSQLLVLTENTAVIRAMKRLIRAADLEPTRVEGEFFTLVRASAKDVVQMLEKLFEKPQQTGAPARPAAVPKPPDGGAPGAVTPQSPAGSPLTTVEIGGMTEDSMLAGKVRLTADERTNRIYVVTRPVNIPVIKKLITEFDQDVPFNEPFVRELKYVSAGDILEALVRAVSDPGAKETGATGATSPTGRTTPASTTQQSSPFGSNSALNRTGGASGGLGGSSTQGLSLQSEPHEVIPQTIVVGNSRIMADKRRNAIIIIGSTDIRDKVNNLIDRLDVRTPQVMLTTIIGELSLDDKQSLGLTYLVGKAQARGGRLGGDLSSLLAGGTTGVVSVDKGAIGINAQNAFASGTITRVLGGGVGGLQGLIATGDNFGSILTALESSNKFRVTSRPTLFASNNKKASLVSGQRVAVITGVLSGAGVGTTGLTSQNQVQYIDVNLSLEVVPLINSDKEVHLDIVQNIAEITSTTQIKQGNEVNDYPVISNRQIQTAVTVPNEGTLILGGLIKQTQDKSTAGVPFLSKAPLIGPLFRSTTASKKRTELVIMIRPSVALNNRDAIEVRDRNMRQMQIPANLEDGLGIETYRSSISDEPSSKFRVNPVVVSPADPRGVYSTPPPTPPPAVIPVVSDPSKASKGASNAIVNQQKR